MKNFILFSFLFFLFFQVSFSQSVAEKKYNEAVEQYRKNEFDSANLLIKELKPLYKSVPPKVVYLEIMTKYAIIKKNPLNDFTIISETRNLTSKYLKDNVAHKNNNYSTIKSLINELNSYPKNQTSFLALKKQMEQEEISKKEAIVIAAAAAKAQEEQMALIRENNRVSDSIKNEKAKIEAEKNRIANAEAKAKNDRIERENEIKIEKERKKQDKK
ncbi:MAG: hypothetical protein C0412_15930, partial [Flavobacterium sp.]|nr:hypothetical protein [Flavobacterium sp.]